MQMEAKDAVFLSKLRVDVEQQKKVQLIKQKEHELRYNLMQRKLD